MKTNGLAFTLGAMSIFLLLFSCQSKEQAPSAEAIAEFEKLGWVLGSWEQFNEATETRKVESWETAGDYSLKGSMTEYQGGKTKVSELMELTIQQDSLYFIADVPHNSSPIPFKLTEITAESFTAENPDHDYPQKIVYTRIDDGQRLKVQTLGGGKRVDYNFFRSEE